MTDERLEMRIPSDLKARMKAAAEADHRSLSSWVIVACEQALTASAWRCDRCGYRHSVDLACAASRGGPKPATAMERQAKLNTAKTGKGKR